VGGDRGAGRPRRLPSHGTVLAARRHRPPLPRHPERPGHRHRRPQPRRTDDGFRQHGRRGVLERHPGLRCAFLEGTCGWLPWYLWRLDEAWEKFGPGSEIQISQTPSQYFFRQCYIATDADEKPLRQVIEAIGDDNIVVSTDYPHADGLFPTAIEEFVRLEGVTDKSKSKILWDNCARLYHLEAAS
jgi:predicted TIM-barrel fold metal-dependent hydrolase